MIHQRRQGTIKMKAKNREDFWILKLKTLRQHRFNAELNFPYP